MSPRKTPLEQMRELAADGLEPWQIAAALGVREAAVAIALQTPTQGGAAGVVERIAGQSPLAAAADDAERDRQAAAAVVPPTFTPAPDESNPVEVTPVVAAILDGAPPLLALEAAASVALDRDPEYGTHVVPDSWAEPGEPPPGTRCADCGSEQCAGYPACAPADVDEVPVEEQHDHDKPCDRCGVPAGTCCRHCSGFVEPAPAEQLDEAEASEVEFDPDDGSTYPCANDRDCGCTGNALLGCLGRDEDARHRAKERREEICRTEPRACEAAAGLGVPHPHVPAAALHSGVALIEERPRFVEPEPPAVAAHATVHDDGTVVEHDVVVRPNDTPHLGVEAPVEPAPVEAPAAEVVERLLDEARAEGEARFARAVEAVAVAGRCAHDIGPAWTESGQAYALCATCGATWHRAPCDVCGVPVAALHIAKTGTPRHAHHLPRKD